MNVGVLHPGEMGQSICRALADSGHTVHWCVPGRSAATQNRAAPYVGLASLDEFVSTVDAIVAVCPPAAALATAQEVMSHGFQGIYVDANAVAPSTSQAIADAVGERYVDGGIIGPPADQSGSTRLYVSGPNAAVVCDWFSGGDLGVVQMGAGVSEASALKMAYAAYTKGSSALLLAVNALAESAGVADHLRSEWSISQPSLEKRSAQAALGTSRKAWRFEGEMIEIARTFAELDLPDGFHVGAAELYARMAELKDQPPAELSEVLKVINKPNAAKSQ